MHHVHTWGTGWDIFWLIFFVAMIILFINAVRRRRFFWGREGFRRKWMSDWMKDCSKTGTFDSAIDILKKRYARGEISEDEFEEMKQKVGV